MNESNPPDLPKMMDGLVRALGWMWMMLLGGYWIIEKVFLALEALALRFFGRDFYLGGVLPSLLIAYFLAVLPMGLCDEEGHLSFPGSRHARRRRAAIG